eukprot:9700682-Karenia_brevis.AAC.1
MLKGQQGALRQFYTHNAEAIYTDLPPGEKWTLSKRVKAIQQGKFIPCSEQANQMLVDLHEKCTHQQFAAP